MLCIALRKQNQKKKHPVRHATYCAYYNVIGICIVRSCMELLCEAGRQNILYNDNNIYVKYDGRVTFRRKKTIPGRCFEFGKCSEILWNHERKNTHIREQQ